MSNTHCKITIADQANVLISGVGPETQDKLDQALKWRQKNCFHMPKYKLGVWDGYINLYKSGWTYRNLINEDILNIIINDGYEIELFDNRRNMPHELETISSDYFSEHPDKNGKPTELRPYQVYAINKAVEENSGMFIMATGSGKTLTCAGLASRFKNHGKVLMIVPTIDLVTQTAKAFGYVGIDCGEFYGEEKIIKDVTISTWQSATNYPEILEGVDCVIADECHKYQAKEVFDFLTIAGKDVPHIYGFTGTLPKDELSLMRLKAVFGEVLYEKTAYELQQEGYLASVNINIIETDVIEKNFQHFQTEESYLNNHDNRNAYLASVIEEIASTGNTLVLVHRIKRGEKLSRLLPQATFIAGSGEGKSTNKERAVEYARMSTEDNQILIATYKIASTGIDVSRWFNLVMVDPTKDFIEIIQSIGRALRKDTDKDHAEIWDFCASSKYSRKHKYQRKKFYKEAKYPFNEVKVKLP